MEYVVNMINSALIKITWAILLIIETTYNIHGRIQFSACGVPFRCFSKMNPIYYDFLIGILGCAIDPYISTKYWVIRDHQLRE